MENINFKEINKNPSRFFKNIKEKELEKILRIASDSYYSSNKELLSDFVFDKLKHYLEENYPKNKFLLEVGAQITDEKDKIKLPVFMGSMNKKKKEKDINNWIKSYPNEIVISDKLDGISFLLTFNTCFQNEIKLYTRGNGKIGKDITKLLEYLGHNLPKGYNLPKKEIKEKIILRGEMIISKNNYGKVIEKGSNARSFISGISNLKKFTKKKLENMKYIDLVCYEVIEPKLTPYEQFKFIEKLNFKCVDYKKLEKLEYSNLEKYLISRKEDGKYEVDGIIVTENKIHLRKEENPKHSFAFKKDLEFVITTVIGVEWNISKHGKLKPIVRIEKVNLLGTDNTACTGNNADFIVKNKIGKGAIIKLIKGGEIIPKIEEVLKPAKEGELPKDIDYKWNETHKEIIIKNFDSDEIKLKRLVIFFKTIGIENIGEGIYKKLFINGYNTILKICKIKISDLIKLDGIKEKSANNIYNSIHDIIDNDIKITKIIVGTCIYDGIGEKILIKLLNKYPKFFEDNEKYNKEDLNIIDSIQDKTSIKILYYLEDIKKFIKELDFLKISSYKMSIKITSKKNIKKFYSQNFVLTGFRDKKIIDFIENNGGKIQTTVNSKTVVLICKEKTGSSKIKKAEELDKKIILMDDFIKKYKIN